MSKAVLKPVQVDPEILIKLQEEFAIFCELESESLLKKYLTRSIFNKLKTKVTPTYYASLLDCIQSGMDNLDSVIGIFAADFEAYKTFADVFDPIIEELHNGFTKDAFQPPKCFGKLDCFEDLDPKKKFIVSIRMECRRSLKGYPFHPVMKEYQYKEIDKKICSTLSCLKGDLKGSFYPLEGMNKPTQLRLIEENVLFKECDRFLESAKVCQFLPSYRALFHNDNKTFIVWCNAEDHLQIISQQRNGNYGEVYKRMVTAVNEIEKRQPFIHDARLGFVTFCPSELGTTIRVSVHIKLPKLAEDKEKLDEAAEKYKIRIREIGEDSVYEITNTRLLGLTEFALVKQVQCGLKKLIEWEKAAGGGF